LYVPAGHRQSVLAAELQGEAAYIPPEQAEHVLHTTSEVEVQGDEAYLPAGHCPHAAQAEDPGALYVLAGQSWQGVAPQV
jgi:hypothetical protein